MVVHNLVQVEMEELVEVETVEDIQQDQIQVQVELQILEAVQGVQEVQDQAHHLCQVLVVVQE